MPRRDNLFMAIKVFRSREIKRPLIITITVPYTGHNRNTRSNNNLNIDWPLFFRISYHHYFLFQVITLPKNVLVIEEKLIKCFYCCSKRLSRINDILHKNMNDVCRDVHFRFRWCSNQFICLSWKNEVKRNSYFEFIYYYLG